MKHRYEFYELKPEGRPLLLPAGWSWFAFVAPPVWAAGHRLWPAALGMSALGGCLAYSATTSHTATTALFSLWLFASWFLADGGWRWAARRTLSQYPPDRLAYHGGILATSKKDAEEQAWNSMEIRKRFFEACRTAPPEHVAQALDILDRDGAL
jgi:hypothetical protein